MRYAMIESGVVTNVILLSDPKGWPVPEGTELVAVSDDIAVSPGFTYDGTTFTDPNPPEPIVIGPAPTASE